MQAAGKIWNIIFVRRPVFVYDFHCEFHHEWYNILMLKMSGPDILIHKSKNQRKDMI